MNQLLTRSINALDPTTRAALQRIIKAGTAPNTIKACRSDMRSFWGWARERGYPQEVLPVPVAVVLQYITEQVDVSKPSTLARRINTLSIIHQYANVDNPCRSGEVKLLLKKARRMKASEGIIVEKKKAATLDIIERMLTTCDGSLIGIRDRALLLFAFSSGGRRRSEVVAVRLSDIEKIPTGFLCIIRHSKTDQDGRGMLVPVLGRAATALQAWLDVSSMPDAYIFRAVNRHNVINPAPLAAQAVARIIKQRALMAGLDPSQFSGHSMRSGFITEGGQQGVPLGDVMALSGHRSVAVAMSYYQAAAPARNKAGMLAG